jgi:hypothetical protein
MSAKALACLLEQARPANERRHLTGALVYGTGRFMHLMEGEQAALEAAYARISQDPRHKNLFKVADYPIAARCFAEWPLAFQTLSLAQFAHLAGYLTPKPLVQHLSIYGSVDTSFIETLRELVQQPAIRTKAVF